jgi:ribosome maturation factor RimP
VGESPLFIWSISGETQPNRRLQRLAQDDMAFDVEQIRATGQRVAASHGLDIVELEFHGGAKHRILRVFIEKNADERKKLVQEVSATANVGDDSDAAPGPRTAAGVDQLAGVTHTDCEVFSRDFGTVLDVEDLIPGAEYTLEVSSPGLDRKLHGVEDYQRFHGMLVKVQTFEPVAGNRHWQGRLGEVSGAAVKLDLTANKPARKKKGAGRVASGSEQAETEVEIALRNIEKAQLVPEF